MSFSILQIAGAVRNDAEVRVGGDFILFDIERFLKCVARRIDCRTHVLWGERGVVHRLFTPLEDWQAKCAQEVTGRALPTGHYIAEEAPDLLAAELEGFFA